MIVFELTFPHRGSWNNKWSGDGVSHIITKKNSKELESLVGKSFRYRWDDGWEACIDVSKYSSTDPEYKKLIKNNRGFCGYNWMVDSIIKSGEIKKHN